MAEIDLKFMNATPELVKAMGSTYIGSKLPEGEDGPEERKKRFASEMQDHVWKDPMAEWYWKNVVEKELDFL